nr:hypothetical protein [uncultured Caproiciproducens sp.]
MKSLDSFLNPKRKPNLKIPLSPAFVDERGNIIEWELKQLTSKEGLDIDGDNYKDIMTACIAESLIYPDMHDAELLKGLSEREGHKILSAKEALLALTTDPEMAALIEAYNKYNELTTDFNKKVGEAKN